MLLGRWAWCDVLDASGPLALGYHPGPREQSLCWSNPQAAATVLIKKIASDIKIATVMSGPSVGPKALPAMVGAPSAVIYRPAYIYYLLNISHQG